MIIDLNTDELQNAVQIARRANEVITDAANFLNSVVIHNDWQCPERSEINSNTTRNRSQALTLQADAESLYNSINYASEQFLVAEQEISKSFESVDGPIASFLSKTPGIGDVSSESYSIWDTTKDILRSAGGGVLGNLKKSTDVVSFEDIANVFKGE